MAEADEKVYEITGMEGVQRRTTAFLREKGELEDASNAVFSEIIGAATRRLGHEQRGNDLTSTTSTSTSTSTTTTSTSTSSSTTTTRSTSTSTTTTRSTSTSTSTTVS